MEIFEYIYNAYYINKYNLPIFLAVTRLYGLKENIKCLNNCFEHQITQTCLIVMMIFLNLFVVSTD